ncbi:unnamed protein product [Diplocarpon coronariae]
MRELESRRERESGWPIPTIVWWWWRERHDSLARCLLAASYVIVIIADRAKHPRPGAQNRTERGRRRGSESRVSITADRARSWSSIHPIVAIPVLAAGGCPSISTDTQFHDLTGVDATQFHDLTGVDATQLHDPTGVDETPLNYLTGRWIDSSLARPSKHRTEPTDALSSSLPCPVLPSPHPPPHDVHWHQRRDRFTIPCVVLFATEPGLCRQCTPSTLEIREKRIRELPRAGSSAQHDQGGMFSTGASRAGIKLALHDDAATSVQEEYGIPDSMDLRAVQIINRAPKPKPPSPGPPSPISHVYLANQPRPSEASVQTKPESARGTSRSPPSSSPARPSQELRKSPG